MKQHNFKVGDKLQTHSGGTTCVVQKIDPSCNNVYAKDFSNGRPDGDELTLPHLWSVIEPTDGSAVTNARAFIDSYDKLEVTILREVHRGKAFGYEGFGASFVHRATVGRRRNRQTYPQQVHGYLEEIAPTLKVPGNYIAIAIYGDNDTMCVNFSTEEGRPPVAVKFAN